MTAPEGPRASSADPIEPGITELSAPAKLTLTLRVTGVRPDGYHLLESEMVTVDLADSLFVGDGSTLTVSTDPGEAVAHPWAASLAARVPSGGENLVARALAAVGRDASVDLVKRIPPGAGLGGGSADAAAVLRWAGCADVSVAARLGADVPFCLTGGRALVRGIGDDLTALPYQEQQFTLLLLPFGVDTGAVYRAWDRLAGTGGLPTPTTSSNDLEAPAVLVEPRLAQWRSVFEDATGRTPHLAGSGSTWFIEGAAHQSGLGGRTSLELGLETARLISVRTAPPLG